MLIMSPLTLKRIKEAKGNVRIRQSDNSSTTPSIVEWYIQVLENDIWNTIFTNRDRVICEQAVQKAIRRVILG